MQQVKRTIVRTSLPDQRRTLVTDLDVFTTNGETLVIAKNNCKIKLNSQLGDSIIVKVLNGALIIPDLGRIDEEWDEIILEKGACVDFRFVEGNWYILSSDGLKIS
jgi:hypothetical protein